MTSNTTLRILSVKGGVPLKSLTASSCPLRGVPPKSVTFFDQKIGVFWAKNTKSAKYYLTYSLTSNKIFNIHKGEKYSDVWSFSYFKRYDAAKVQWKEGNINRLKASCKVCRPKPDSIEQRNIFGGNMIFKEIFKEKWN